MWDVYGRHFTLVTDHRPLTARCLQHWALLLSLYTYKYKEKFVILQAIGNIQIKSKETRVVAYTCRYSSGPLMPNSATATD